MHRRNKNDRCSKKNIYRKRSKFLSIFCTENYGRFFKNASLRVYIILMASIISIGLVILMLIVDVVVKKLKKVFTLFSTISSNIQDARLANLITSNNTCALFVTKKICLSKNRAKQQKPDYGAICPPFENMQFFSIINNAQVVRGGQVTNHVHIILRK